MVKGKYPVMVQFLTLLLTLGLITHLYALTVARASLQELTEESSIVVAGKVEQIKYEWGDRSSKVIHTKVTLSVNEQLKGQNGSKIVFRQLGGKMGDFGMDVPGTPQFRIGDEVILFLVEHKAAYWIHSIALGCYHVSTAEDGQQIVFNNLGDINVVDPATRQPVSREQVNTPQPRNEFIQRIQSYLE